MQARKKEKILNFSNHENRSNKHQASSLSDRWSQSPMQDLTRIPRNIRAKWWATARITRSRHLGVSSKQFYRLRRYVNAPATWQRNRVKVISHSPRSRNKARCHRYERHEGNRLSNGLIGLEIATSRWPQRRFFPVTWPGHDESKLVGCICRITCTRSMCSW